MNAQPADRAATRPGTARNSHGHPQQPSAMPIHRYVPFAPIGLHRPHLAGARPPPARRCGAASTCATATRR